MDAQSILADLRKRKLALEPVIAEFRRLEAADRALELVMQDHPLRSDDAPYGYKRDGTPRKRPGRPRRRGETHSPSPTPAAPQEPARRGQEVRLNVLSSTHPTEQELEDREVVHTTEEPA